MFFHDHFPLFGVNFEIFVRVRIFNVLKEVSYAYQGCILKNKYIVNQ